MIRGHEIAVAESIFQLLKREWIKKNMYEAREGDCSNILITSDCFITVFVGMVRAHKCHTPNMKINIIKGSEVSSLAVPSHWQY